jgi:hypothetical protein
LTAGKDRHFLPNIKTIKMKTFRLTILDYNRETLFFMNINADGYLEASKKARRTLETTNDNRAFTFELEQLTF